MNGAATGAVSVAYTNNDNDPSTGTTLFYINSGSPSNLYNTTNPNGGVLSAVGPLGVSTSDNVGFDISGLSGSAYASLTPVTGAGSSFYRINLTTGAATLVGSVGSTGVVLYGIAAPISAPDTGSALVLLALGTGTLFTARRFLNTAHS